MIIISDCLTDYADEGTIKIASKLAKLLKNKGRASVYQINKESSFSDKTFKTGKLGISKDLIREISKEDGNILYIPNASMTLGICVKVCVLKFLSHKKIYLLPVYRRRINSKMKVLLTLSKVNIITLSEESYRDYKTQISNKVFYVKAGVDTEQFNLCSYEVKLNLRDKHGYCKEDVVILHIGHMVEARNLRSLVDLNKNYKIILIISTSTRWDQELYNEIAKEKNISIIHEYIPNIEEYYQMADVYYFPVQKIGCVDVPLSVLEASACGTAIVTTPYGELKTFKETDSFRFIKDFNMSDELIESVRHTNSESNRKAVLEYDWNMAADNIISIVEAKV